MEKDIVLQIFLILGGLFTLAGGLFNWNWFMENRRARAVVSILGRKGARGLYIVMGLFLAIFGIVLATGFVSKP